MLVSGDLLILLDFFSDIFVQDSIRKMTYEFEISKILSMFFLC